MILKEKEQDKGPDRSVEIRNILLPLATGKPNVYKKLFVIVLSVFYLMLTFSYLTDAYFMEYPWFEAGLIILCMTLISKVYDIIYVHTLSSVIRINANCAVIGFSNKLLLISGEEVMNEYEADEIKIRPVMHDEEEVLFKKYTSILECRRKGNVIGIVAVDRMKEYEGMVLKADMSRADEDMEVIYDDEDFDDDGDIITIKFDDVDNDDFSF